jgi:chromo domain-containing protein 1
MRKLLNLQSGKSISDASLLARTLDEGYQPPVELSRFKAAPNAGNDHSRAAPPVPIHTSAQQPRESESDYNHLSPVDEPTAPQALMIVLPTPTYMQAPTRINCTEMKNVIESACELDFEKLFRQNDKNDGHLDRRAFLMFHPKDHMEEFDLITRWLMMHHVEVCSLWLDGSWDYFLQSVMGGGTGVVLVSM